MTRIFFCTVLALAMVCCNDDKKTPKEIPAEATPTQEKQLKEAITAHPDSLLLKENLIQYFRDNGNYYHAIREVNNALRNDSSNARLWDIKATLHFEDGDTLNSINAFEHAIEIFPDPAYIISLGTLYAQTKNPKAIELADALLIGNKANADKEAFFIKGLYYAYINEKLKAIGYFDQCLSLSYTFMDAYREKAIALYDLGKYQEALAVLDKAITLQNNFDEGYYYSGRCLEKLNRKAEAIQSYQNALIYDPNYIEAKDALAKLGVKQ